MAIGPGPSAIHCRPSGVSRAGADEAHILGMAEAAKCLVLLERDLSQADAMAMEARALAQRIDVQNPALPSAMGLLRYFEGRLDDAVEHLEDARTIWQGTGRPGQRIPGQ